MITKSVSLKCEEMSLMSIKNTLKNRVSTTKFTKDNVNPKTIIDLLDFAVYAPNHKMREPWRFIILEGEGKTTFVSKYISSFKEIEQSDQQALIHKAFQAPLVLAIVMPKNPDFRDELEDLQACAALIENFLLLLTEEGLSGAWKTPMYIESDRFKDILGLSSQEIVVGLIMVGYPEQIPNPKSRKSARDLTTIYS
jgi:nitroreductase